MMKCNMCPRYCDIEREKKSGFCKMPDILTIARAALHMWEEPCISGTHGSGTVFFSGCNMRCIYCQNHMISHKAYGEKVTVERFIRVIQTLEAQGAHNINLVTPTHFISVLAPILAAHPVGLPIVYNSSGYDTVSSLRTLHGSVDVYLPDMKYADNDLALAYSQAGDYVQVSRAAVLEMYRQVGNPQLDDEGLMQKGLMIRHMILPGHADDSRAVLSWIADHLPKTVYVSLLAQYTPIEGIERLGRRVTRREVERVTDHMIRLGLTNGYVQQRSSAKGGYTPDFDLTGVIE